MKTIDPIFGWLLFLGGIGHGLGSIRAYGHNQETLLWALCATLAVWLLAALNLLRAGRPADHTLAWVSFAGCLGWFVAAVAFGRLVGMLDFRALINLILALALAIFSLRTALGKARPASVL
ncbi:MAG TPA: hypothetical protein VKX41_18240 [Alloacidobacterium sp.]|jgi:hypothetical protein|nr:hypothetical protein [Alloacidobacterium sp.]